MFFPMKGISITDEHPQFQKPVFGDATLVSRSHVREFVPWLKLNERMSPRHNHEADVTYMLEHATLQEEFQAFIAVRRTGILTERTFRQVLVEQARSRASQIAATLALVFLLDSKTGKTCGLVEQLHRQTKSVVALEFNEGGFMFSTGGGHSHTIVDNRKSIQVSISQLREILTRKEFIGLSSILLEQKSSCARSIRKALTASVVRLSDAIHSISAAAQLLGAVTAIEILLAENGDTYENIVKRIAILLGTPALEAFRAKDVFAARHTYVHRGEEPKIPSPIPLNSIGIALNTIFRFAELAPKFPSKRHILEYLDLIEKAEHLGDDLGAETLAQIRRHTPSYQKLPFLRPS